MSDQSDEYNAFGLHDDSTPAVQPPDDYDLGDEDDETGVSA